MGNAKWLVYVKCVICAICVSKIAGSILNV